MYTVSAAAAAHPFRGGRRRIHRPRRAWLWGLGAVAVLAGSFLVAGPVFSLAPGAAADPAVPPDLPASPLPEMSVVFDLLQAQAAYTPAPVTRDWVRDRLGKLTPPIAGSRPSGFEGHLPNAPRAYRGGTHLGLDYYSGSCGVEVRTGTPVLAVAGGVVIRADTDYVEITPAQREKALQAASAAGDTDPRVVDPLHGRQVWVLHAAGVISRYSHLSSVAPDVVRGAPVSAGQVLGKVGNSGTAEGVRGSGLGAHLHFELYIDFRPAWAGIPAPTMPSFLREILSAP